MEDENKLNTPAETPEETPVPSPEQKPEDEHLYDDEFLDDRRAVLDAEEEQRRAEEEAQRQQEPTPEEKHEEKGLIIDGVDMHLPEEEAPKPETQAPAGGAPSEYEDPRFQTIEDGRTGWQKKYRVWSFGKVGVSVLSFGLIIAGWLVPKNIWPDNANLTLGISIGVAVFAIAIALSFYIVTAILLHKLKKPR